MGTTTKRITTFRPKSEAVKKMARGTKTGGARKQRSALSDVVARDYTIHMHTKVHGASFKKRAPTAIKAVVAFAQKTMGIKDVPHRLRVRLERKRNDNEDAKEKLYTLASHVPVSSFRGLQTTTVDVEEDAE